MNTRLIIPVLVFMVILLGLGVWVGKKLSEQNPAGPSHYSAVYLTTGDVYFGKLDWFPWPHLKNAWLLQRGADAQNQVHYSVVPVTNAFWGPVSELYLNPKQVVFWTRLRNDSQVAQVIENPSLLQNQEPPAAQGIPELPTSTSGIPALPEGLLPTGQ